VVQMRKIRTNRLLISGVVYRLHIIVCQSIYWYLFYGITKGMWEWNWAISSSVIWNIFNTALYYNYHYWFARLVKLGKNNT